MKVLERLFEAVFHSPDLESLAIDAAVIHGSGRGRMRAAKKGAQLSEINQDPSGSLRGYGGSCRAGRSGSAGAALPPAPVVVGLDRKPGFISR